MVTKRDTKAELLQAAVEMMWAQSYGGVSVDDICAKAKAKKGSFYHYFSSKSELAIAAMEHLWEVMRPTLDQCFSPQQPPLQRIRQYAEESLREQANLRDQFGYIVGCPFASVGSEQCSCNDGLSKKSEEMFTRMLTYLRSAIQDAVAEGSLPRVDPQAAAAKLLTYELGALAFARVSNSLTPLEGLFDVWMTILRADGDLRSEKAAPAAA